VKLAGQVFKIQLLFYIIDKMLSDKLEEGLTKATLDVLASAGLDGFSVRFRDNGIWHTYSDYGRRRIQYGERCLRHFLRGGSFYLRCMENFARARHLETPQQKVALVVLEECAHAYVSGHFGNGEKHGEKFLAALSRFYDSFFDVVFEHVKELTMDDVGHEDAKQKKVYLYECPECGRRFHRKRRIIKQRVSCGRCDSVYNPRYGLVFKGDLST
jgi:predicted SprT family Zn-dependent metalloprotease